LLDLCIVEGMPRADFVRLALKLRAGEHVGEPGVHYVQLRTLHVEAQAPIIVNVDGEPSDGYRLTYRARARDLVVHLPQAPDAQSSLAERPEPAASPSPTRLPAPPTDVSRHG
jgi:diacylglycerol kinase family enzyme